MKVEGGLSESGFSGFKDEQDDDSILPDWMSTNEMRQAMTILSVFSEKERAYFQYQARQEYLREQRMLQRDLEKLDKLQKSEQAALQREQLALQREQQALLEIERLKALLNKQS